MSLTLFCPTQLEMQTFGFDTAEVLHCDYARLKGTYSMAGLLLIMNQLTNHITGLFTQEDWMIVDTRTVVATDGTLYFIGFNLNGEPMIVAKADRSGQFWDPYITRRWADHVVGFVDAEEEAIHHGRATAEA